LRTVRLDAQQQPRVGQRLVVGAVHAAADDGQRLLVAVDRQHRRARPRLRRRLDGGLDGRMRSHRRCRRHHLDPDHRRLRPSTRAPSRRPPHARSDSQTSSGSEHN
jgi:hypothetical protein